MSGTYYAEDGESAPLRNPQKPCGICKKVIDIIRLAFDILPDEDVSEILEGPRGFPVLTL